MCLPYPGDAEYTSKVDKQEEEAETLRQTEEKGGRVQARGQDPANPDADRSPGAFPAASTRCLPGSGRCLRNAGLQYVETASEQNLFNF